MAHEKTWVKFFTFPSCVIHIVHISVLTHWMYVREFIRGMVYVLDMDLPACSSRQSPGKVKENKAYCMPWVANPLLFGKADFTALLPPEENTKQC